MCFWLQTQASYDKHVTIHESNQRYCYCHLLNLNNLSIISGCILLQVKKFKYGAVIQDTITSQSVFYLHFQSPGNNCDQINCQDAEESNNCVLPLGSEVRFLLVQVLFLCSISETRTVSRRQKVNHSVHLYFGQCETKLKCLVLKKVALNFTSTSLCLVLNLTHAAAQSVGVGMDC